MLELAYEEHGAGVGVPILLLHGFPYSPRAYDGVIPPLAAHGHRVIVPYLRGYGPTQFRSPTTMRSGQQAALARDLVDLLDALSIQRAALVGYDWGGRAACIVAALWPERVRCLVAGQGYLIQDIARAVVPAHPRSEQKLWYQYYFHTARGIAGLTNNRREFCRLLWQDWSPSWPFDDSTFDATAVAFDNTDFVDVVIHSYRHRFGYAPGDPALERLESQLSRQPTIAAPTIALWGDNDGVSPPAEADADRPLFSGFYERRRLPGVGHNLPQEAPAAVVAALSDLLRRADG